MTLGTYAYAYLFEKRIHLFYNNVRNLNLTIINE